jgi:hypothetical protein
VAPGFQATDTVLGTVVRCTDPLGTSDLFFSFASSGVIPERWPNSVSYPPRVKGQQRDGRFAYRALTLCAAALVASGCGSSGDAQTYSVAEARDAFRDFDLQVVYEDPPGANLRPATGEPFLVSVERADADLDDQGWAASARVWADDAAFAARRANVAVSPNADGRQITDEERERVLAALNALPDRGDPVMVAGQ